MEDTTSDAGESSSSRSLTKQKGWALSCHYSSGPASDDSMVYMLQLQKPNKSK